MILEEKMNGEISEADAKTLIDEHLREQGWNLKDFSIIRKEHTTPHGNSTDYIFLKESVPFAILEAPLLGSSNTKLLELLSHWANRMETLFLRHNECSKA